MSFLDDFFLLDIFGGLRTTAKHLFRRADTKQYPEQVKEPSDRFRGMFRLDEERCIKCTLCAIECPIDIIFIDWHNEKNAETTKNEKVRSEEHTSELQSHSDLVCRLLLEKK